MKKSKLLIPTFWLLFTSLFVSPTFGRTTEESDGADDDFVFLRPQSQDYGSTEPHPDRLRVSLNGSLVLDLKKTHVTSLNAPVYVVENGKIHKLELPNVEDTQFYQDGKYLAAISVTKRSTANGEFERVLEGHFTIDGAEFVIGPATEEQVRRKRRDADDNEDSGTWHVMHMLKSIDPYAFQNDAIFERNLANQQPLFHSKAFTRHKRATQNLGIELLAVIDYAIYSRHYTTSTGSTEQEKAQKAIEDIRYYFAHIANGIDIRYGNIDDSEFSIYVRLVGYVILKDATSASFIETIKDSQLNSLDGLNAFTTWLNARENANEVPNHDHGMLFTGYELWRNYKSDGTRNTAVAGTAHLNGICGTNKHSINEDFGGFKSITVCAHELGHNLGAWHDGTIDGTGDSCPASDQFIMAPSVGGTSALTHLNPYYFSTCSIEYFRRHINYLNSNNINCLLNTAVHFNDSEWESYMNLPPGQRYPPHEQCRQIYGPFSYYCGGATADANICVRMFCYNPNEESCGQPSGLRAARGTQCGDNKWCIEGVCTYNSSAPSGRDNCTHGDSLSQVYSNNQATCQTYRSNNNTRGCYTDYFRNLCCLLCLEAYDPTWIGCEYGDHFSYCATITDPSTQCTGTFIDGTTVQERCCATCGERPTTVSATTTVVTTVTEPTTTSVTESTTAAESPTTTETTTVSVTTNEPATTSVTEPTTVVAPTTTTETTTMSTTESVTTNEPATTSVTEPTTVVAPTTTTETKTMPTTESETTNEPATTSVTQSTTVAEPPTTTEIPPTSTTESVKTNEPTTHSLPICPTAPRSPTITETTTMSITESVTTNEPATTSVTLSTTVAEPTTSTEIATTMSTTESVTTNEPETTSVTQSTTVAEPTTTTETTTMSTTESITTNEPATTSETESTTVAEPTTTTETTTMSTTESVTTNEPATTSVTEPTTVAEPTTTTETTTMSTTVSVTTNVPTTTLVTESTTAAEPTTTTKTTTSPTESITTNEPETTSMTESTTVAEPTTTTETSTMSTTELVTSNEPSITSVTESTTVAEPTTTTETTAISTTESVTTNEPVTTSVTESTTVAEPTTTTKTTTMSTTESMTTNEPKTTSVTESTTVAEPTTTTETITTTKYTTSGETTIPEYMTTSPNLASTKETLTTDNLQTTSVSITTSTSPSTSTISTTTTMAPRFLIFIWFRIIIVFKLQYTPDLDDPSSSRFKLVEVMVCRLLRRGRRIGFHCRVRRCRRGSIVAETELGYEHDSQQPVTYNTTQLQDELRMELLNDSDSNVTSLSVTDADECENPDTNDCSPSAICVNQEGGYTCRCRGNYRDNSALPTIKPGRSCGRICDDSYCQNGGVCNEIQDGEPVCTCKVNFGGTRCETNLQQWKTMVIALVSGVGVMVLIIIMLIVVICFVKKRQKLVSTKAYRDGNSSVARGHNKKTLHERGSVVVTEHVHGNASHGMPQTPRDMYGMPVREMAMPIPTNFIDRSFYTNSNAGYGAPEQPPERRPVGDMRQLLYRPTASGNLHVAHALSVLPDYEDLPYTYGTTNDY